VITGVHAIVFSEDAEAVRAFMRDTLGLPSVDAGGGWLIFALPPAELAAHPADAGGRHQLYLMCDDVEATVAELSAKGVEFTRPVSDEGWGLVTALALPGGGELGLYEPRHPLPPR
jgi:catechol 2,3-dioxygenase-like lactoylglutathione lyase family enzyme